MRHLPFLLTFALAASACILEEDYDADGYGVSEDCDDHRATVHPGAQELCNGMDENCDGFVDNGGFGPGAGTRQEAAAYYPDTDGDGFGDSDLQQWACDVPFEGAVTQGGDCDDADEAVYPGAPEDCDGVDDLNCDGQLPPDCPVGEGEGR